MKGSIGLGFLGCCLAGTVAAQSAERFYPNIPAAQDRYAAYEDAEVCDGPELVELLDFLDVRMTFAKASLVTNDLGITADGAEIANKTGSAIIAIGDLALSKDCLREARTLYLTVIETFTGDAYSALRDRAMIGIDDIRAKG